MSVRLQESFSKLVVPFVFAATKDAPTALARVRGEIRRLPGLLKHGEEPDPGRTVKLLQWEPIPAKVMARGAERLASPLPYYLLGAGQEQDPSGSGHVVALRWSDELIGYFVELRFAFAKERSVVLDLTAVEIYLFSSGAGMLAIEIMPREPRVLVKSGGEEANDQPLTAADLVEINYRLRGLSARRPASLISLRWLRARERAGTPQPVTATQSATLRDRLFSGQGFSLLDVIHHCRESLAQLVDIGDPAGTDAHLLTFARTEAGIEFQDCAEDFFRLRRAYDWRYKPPAWALRPETAGDEILQSFEQVFLGASADACAVLVIDDGTEFFRQLGDRVRHSYFVLFLLAIHARTMLEELALRSCRLPAIHVAAQQTSRARAPLIKSVRDVRKSVAEFTLHHSQYVVSHVHMYQEIYERMIRSMRVPLMHARVEAEIADMQRILDDHDQEESSRARDQLALLVGVLGVVSLLLSFWSANWREVQDHSIVDVWVVLSAAGAVLLSLLLFARLRPTRGG